MGGRRRREIRDLYINGEKQRLNYESRIFQYEISGYGKYTVRVQAEDLAGNRSEESISFLVERERKGLAAFFDPVGALSGGYQDSGSGTESEMRSAVPVLIVICAGCVCLGCWAGNSEKRKKSGTVRKAEKWRRKETSCGGKQVQIRKTEEFNLL